MAEFLPQPDELDESGALEDAQSLESDVDDMIDAIFALQAEGGDSYIAIELEPVDPTVDPRGEALLPIRAAAKMSQEPASDVDGEEVIETGAAIPPDAKQNPELQRLTKRVLGQVLAEGIKRFKASVGPVGRAADEKTRAAALYAAVRAQVAYEKALQNMHNAHVRINRLVYDTANVAWEEGRKTAIQTIVTVVVIQLMS